MVMAINGFNTFAFDQAALALRYDKILGFTTSFGGGAVLTLGLSYDAADVMDCGNGGIHDRSCTFNLTTAGLQGVSVSSLPASPAAGMVAYVTDANAGCSAGTTPSGGGSNKCFVGYNGSAWKEFGI